MNAAAFDAIVHARKSTRAFLPVPVPRAVIEDILSLTARAPSGNNNQPWRVHVATGPVLGRVVDEVCTAFDTADGSHVAEYAYYPTEFFEPYLSRRRRISGDLYGVLGIAKGDREWMRAQLRGNFEFFGAPVALVVTIDRRLAQGSWLDCGMFIQNPLRAATSRGLGSCAQAAWIDYHRILGRLLGFDPQEQRRRHCHRPPPRRLRRPTGAHRRAGTGKARRPLRPWQIGIPPAPRPGLQCRCCRPSWGAPGPMRPQGLMTLTPAAS